MVRRCTVLAAAVCCALVGCGGSPAGSGAVAPSAPGGDPTRLVATWTVTSPSEAANEIVLFGDRVDGGVEVFLPCGLMSGQWRANTAGMFIASEDGGDASCFTDHVDRWPRWLTAVAFEFDGSDLLLLDDHRTVTARLMPGGHPTTGPNDSGEFASPPALTPDLRKSFVVPEPLPRGVSPADPRSVVGRWVPVNRSPAKAYVEFTSGGGYAGSDGCNGVAGRYVVGAAGLVLATSGPSTAVGCANSPLPGWAAQSGRLGLRAHRLVFVDPSGTVIGEAVRS